MLQDFIRRLRATGGRVKARLDWHYLPLYFADGQFAFPPRTIYLAVNSKCNARCVMCDIGQKNRQSTFYNHLAGNGDVELSPEIERVLIDQVKKFEPSVAIVSTEPLLYKSLLAISEYIIEAGLHLSITTNGILLTKYAEEFVRLGVNRLYLSLDGLEEEHDKVRGRGTFARAITGLETVNEFKRRHGKSKPEICINYTISSLNYHNLVDFAQYMQSQGVASITFSHLNYVTEEMARAHNAKFGHLGLATKSSLGVVDLRAVDVEVLCQQIEEVKARFSGQHISFIPDLVGSDIVWKYNNEPSFIVSKRTCLAPWLSMQVLPNGNVTVLTRCFDIKLGNIYEQSFAEIWNGPAYQRIRKSLRQHGLFPACTRCCGAL